MASRVPTATGRPPYFTHRRSVMGDLSPFLPQESETVRAIFAYNKKLGDAEPERGYLGASIIGHECDRYLWLMFRGCAKRTFDGRMHRLFERGRREESWFVDELRGIGCTVHEKDPNTNEQVEVVALGGHFRGHLDGVALGIPEAPKTWHVLEFKTHNDKSFSALVKVGVKAAKPMHYAQMMVEMGLSKLSRALNLASNKDTDALHSERIDYDASEFKAIMARAERIIKAPVPPGRLASRPDDFRCKFCEAQDLCWGTGEVALPVPRKTCRTCCHATPEMDGDGRWSCSKGRKAYSPCELHLVIPHLILFADPVDAGDTWIQFQNHKDGEVWRHGSNTADGEWTTEELMKTPAPLVGNRTIQKAKDLFDATVTEVSKGTLIDRYPPGDSRLRWEGKPDDIDDWLADKAEDDIQAAFQTDFTDTQEDEKYDAWEYAGRFLLVVYKADNYAAIWEGVE